MVVCQKFLVGEAEGKIQPAPPVQIEGTLSDDEFSKLKEMAEMVNLDFCLRNATIAQLCFSLDCALKKSVAPAGESDTEHGDSGSGEESEDSDVTLTRKGTLPPFSCID
jgi:hypothetical protein